MSISRIFELIRNESSKNKKMDILREHKDNELLKKILLYTYDPLRNYYIKRYEDHEVGNVFYSPLENVFPMLDSLSTRKISGYSAVDLIEDTTISLNPESKVILRGIIDRTQHLGIEAKSINKIWDNLIPSIGYMRCSLLDKLDKITYPAICQRKEDGLFVNVIYKDGDIRFLTRAGNEFYLTFLKVELLNQLQNIGTTDVVFHGELLVESADNDGVESRKVGNGMINSLIKKEQTMETLQEKLNACRGTAKSQKVAAEIHDKEMEFQETNKRLQIVLWDAVSYENWIDGYSPISYKCRFNGVENVASRHVKVVESKIVNSFDEAQSFYKEQIDSGYEGAVLKNLNGEWRNHTSPNQIKMKSEKVCELEIIGIETGSVGGEYENGIGSIICKSSDGKVLVNVGIGLSNTQRGFERVDKNDSSKGLRQVSFDFDWMIGSIVSVKFNEIISSKSKDTWSLFLPRLINERHDKTEADDFEYISKL